MTHGYPGIKSAQLVQVLNTCVHRALTCKTIILNSATLRQWEPKGTILKEYVLISRTCLSPPYL